MKVEGHEIEASNCAKVFFPGAGLTKGDLIDYYEQRGFPDNYTILIAAGPENQE